MAGVLPAQVWSLVDDHGLLEFRWSARPVAAFEWVVGCWAVQSKAVLLAVVVWVGLLKLPVSRAASVEGSEVAWKCVQVERLDAIGHGYGGSTKLPVLML